MLPTFAGRPTSGRPWLPRTQTLRRQNGGPICCAMQLLTTYWRCCALSAALVRPAAAHSYRICLCRLFVFGQVRVQGEECTTSHAITGRLPLDHIPELMCALGYYPTQAEITDMISNMAYSAALAGEEKPVDASLETFLYLYHNFKPVHGVRCQPQSLLRPVLLSLNLRTPMYPELCAIPSCHGSKHASTVTVHFDASFCTTMPIVMQLGPACRRCWMR